MIENPASNTVAADQLRSFIDRLTRLEEEIKGLNDDKSDVLKEAKSQGFDAKVIKKVMAILRRDPAERQEEEAILAMYLSALGVLD